MRTSLPTVSLNAVVMGSMSVEQTLTGQGLTAEWSNDQKDAFTRAVSLAIRGKVSPSNVVITSIQCQNCQKRRTLRALLETSVTVKYQLFFDVGTQGNDVAAYAALSSELQAAVGGGDPSPFTKALQATSSSFAGVMSGPSVTLVNDGLVSIEVNKATVAPTTSPTLSKDESSSQADTAALQQKKSVFATVGIVLGILLAFAIVATYAWIRRDFERSIKNTELLSKEEGQGQSTADDQDVEHDDTVGENPLFAAGAQGRRQSTMPFSAEPGQVAPRRISVQTVVPRKAPSAEDAAEPKGDSEPFRSPAKSSRAVPAPPPPPDSLPQSQQEASPTSTSSSPLPRLPPPPSVQFGNLKIAPPIAGRRGGSVIVSQSPQAAATLPRLPPPPPPPTRASLVIKSAEDEDAGL
jgi:hypothetical protein